MPQHRTLRPIVQKPGLVRNLLEQLGMVGPYRWELVESIQPVIVVAEQAPSQAGVRACGAGNLQTMSAQTWGSRIFNPVGSGVIARIRWISAIVDTAIPSFRIGQNSAIGGGADMLPYFRQQDHAGAPSCLARAQAAGHGLGGQVLAFLEANVDSGSNWIQDTFLWEIAPGQGITIDMATSLTGSIWLTWYWDEISIR